MCGPQKNTPDCPTPLSEPSSTLKQFSFLYIQIYIYIPTYTHTHIYIFAC